MHSTKEFIAEVSKEETGMESIVRAIRLELESANIAMANLLALEHKLTGELPSSPGATQGSKKEDSGPKSIVDQLHDQISTLSTLRYNLEMASERLRKTI